MAASTRRTGTDPIVHISAHVSGNHVLTTSASVCMLWEVSETDGCLVKKHALRGAKSTGVQQVRLPSPYFFAVLTRPPVSRLALIVKSESVQGCDRPIGLPNEPLRTNSLKSELTCWHDDSHPA